MALQNHQERLKQIEANTSLKLNSTLVLSSAYSAEICDQLWQQPFSLHLHFILTSSQASFTIIKYFAYCFPTASGDKTL